MATQFAEITLEEMDRFLKRGWRALRPKQSIHHNVNVYDLFLSKSVMIRVWTSIPARRETVRDVGETTIKIQLLNAHSGRPLVSGKALFAKRVLGWKNNLQDRIEDYIELYEEKEEYFEALAGNHQQQTLPGTEEKEDDREREEVEQEQEAPPPRRTDFQATFQKLKTGDWGLRIKGRAEPGDQVVAVRQSGQRQTLTVGEVVWRGMDFGQPITVATIGRSRTAGEEPERISESEPYSYEREA